MARSKLTAFPKLHTHTHTQGSSKSRPRGNGQSSALLPTEHFVPPERKHTDLSQQLSSNKAASLPLLLFSSLLQPLFLSSLVPRCTPLPSLILGTCDVCVNTHKHQTPRSPLSLIHSLSLPLLHVAAFAVRKELALSRTQTGRTSPCSRWRDAESSFGIQ